MTYLHSPLFDAVPTLEHGFAGRGVTLLDIKKRCKFNDIVVLNQIHGDVVHDITLINDQPLQGDGLTTKMPNIGLIIKSADCGCILLYAPDTKRIAAIHAGWQGVYKDIITVAIKKITDDPAKVYAAIGPCIRQSSYQVDDVFYKRFINKYAESKHFFINDNPQHYLFDLPAMIIWQLKNNGVVYIHDLNIDTYSHDDFYSHRRATHNNTASVEGRNLSYIGLNI